MNFNSPDPQTNWKFLAIVVILGLVSSGGILFLRTLSFISSSPIPPTVQQLPPLPVIKLQSQQKVYEGAQGSYCWSIEDEEGNLCVDRTFPDPQSVIQVATGDSLTVKIMAHEKPLNLSAFIFTPTGDAIPGKIELDPVLNSRLDIDLSTGTYIVIVAGAWKDEGDISYGFKIDVQPQKISTPIDTSTWQTYRNDEFGFEVKFPPDWTFRIAGGRASFLITFYPEVYENNYGIPIAVSLWFLDEKMVGEEYDSQLDLSFTQYPEDVSG